jgi:hypothetical protein
MSYIFYHPHLKTSLGPPLLYESDPFFVQQKNELWC